MASSLPVTAPSNTSVLDPVPPGSGFTGPGRYITLTTCTPEFTSKYRLIVWGKMVEERPRSKGKPDALVEAADRVGSLGSMQREGQVTWQRPPATPITKSRARGRASARPRRRRRPDRVRRQRLRRTPHHGRPGARPVRRLLPVVDQRRGRPACGTGRATRCATTGPAGQRHRCPGALDTKDGIGFLHVPAMRNGEVLVEKGTSIEGPQRGCRRLLHRPGPGRAADDRQGRQLHARRPPRRPWREVPQHRQAGEGRPDRLRDQGRLVRLQGVRGPRPRPRSTTSRCSGRSRRSPARRSPATTSR